MPKEYLAKYRSRTSNTTISFYKNNGFIHRIIMADRLKVFSVVDSVPSIISGYEEVGLKDG